MQNLYFGYHIRNRYKNDTVELLEIFGRLDAWYSMALAMKNFDLRFPEFIELEKPTVNAKGLYHLLLKHPVSYDLELNPDHNFLFLTGANMAGKSTLIKSVGLLYSLLISVWVCLPQQMTLTLFDGLLTNINVVDNIAKGESYFFNEVQRVKNTLRK
jgi:DNA mismatch repair ATPase MutS